MADQLHRSRKLWPGILLGGRQLTTHRCRPFPAQPLCQKCLVVKPRGRSWLAILVGLYAALIFVHGCANESALGQRVNGEKQDLSAEDAARFLAGLHGRSDSWFAELERTQAWQSYAARLGRTWGELDASQFQAVRTFQGRELSSIHSGSSFVFYPFSGPDVLYATLFFPNCRLFVLAGLEPAGSLRTLYN